MLSKPTLYLHFGMYKTATTSIQKLFTKHRYLLHQHNILYPTSFRDSGHAHYGLNAAFSFLRGDTLAVGRSGFDAELEESGAGNVILSNEFLTPTRSEHYEEFWNYFNGYDVKIVLFLRHHVDWLVSMYSESLARQEPIWQPGFKEYCKFQLDFNKQPWFYSQLLAEYAAICGKENLIVIPYDPSLFYGGCVAKQLLVSTGLATPGLLDKLPGAERQNRSLDPRLFPVLEELIRDPSLNKEQRDSARKKLIESGVPDSEPDSEIVNNMKRFVLEFMKDHIAEYPAVVDEYMPAFQHSLFNREYEVK